MTGGLGGDAAVIGRARAAPPGAHGTADHYGTTAGHQEDQ